MLNSLSLRIIIFIFSSFNFFNSKKDVDEYLDKYAIDILDKDFEKVSNDFDYFKKKSKYIFYCDTGDSSCWIEKKIFPLVDKYLKCQLLKDKNLYKMKMYGKKINSDFLLNWSVPPRGLNKKGAEHFIPKKFLEIDLV